MLIRLDFSTCVNTVRVWKVRTVKWRESRFGHTCVCVGVCVVGHYFVLALNSLTRHHRVSFGIEMHANEFSSLSPGLRGNL